jgi:hypothetical protein
MGHISENPNTGSATTLARNPAKTKPARSNATPTTMMRAFDKSRCISDPGTA